jgi:photosystem II stability/assembly factor-like uncharacterized protein
MRYLVFVIFFLIGFKLTAQKPKINVVLSDIPSSIRGLSVVDDQVIWFSGSKGFVGRSMDGGHSWQYRQLTNFEKVDFRSLYAFDSLNAIIANAGSPASILKTADGGKTWKAVYQNDHPDIFLDGIDFWDAQSGLIYGDPVEGRMTLLKTTNGGETWSEIPANQRPALEKGEASFAASGTGIRCFDKGKTIVATGGMVSRLWISEDWGERWVSLASPIIQGKSTTGIFSVSINMKTWLTVGGDYEVDTLSNKNTFYSRDGGKSWIAPKKSTRGYRSAVEFINGKTWLAVGQSGFDITADNGNSWIPMSDEKGFHVVRRARLGKKVLAAGNRRIVVIELN